MSRSREDTELAGAVGKAGDPELRIASPAGVEYRIFDGHGEERFRGTGDSQITLPQGLYAIHWLSAGTQQETLLRLADRNEPTLALFPRPASTAIPDAAGFASSVAPQLTSTTMPLANDASMVSVIVRRIAATAGESIPVTDGLRLVDDRAREQAPDPAQDGEIVLQPGEVAQHFSVKPGDYLLGFRAVTGETLQQTVPALPGRRTLIFQEEVRAKVFVAEGEVFRDQWRYGVDPARTVIITVSGGEAQERIRERLRLADVLLHDIATGSTSLDRKFIGILDDPNTDPLLRLLGAVVAIRNLKTGGGTGSRDASARVEADSKADAACFVSAEQVLNWLSLDRGIHVSPDETVARWQLATLIGNGRAVRSRGSVMSPPMLEAVWRWALEGREAGNGRSTITETPTTRAAASSAVSASAWLCWRASAAKAAETSIPSREELSAQLRDVIASVTDLVSRAGMANSEPLSKFLKPETRQATLQMLDKFASSDTLDHYSQLLTLNPKLSQIVGHVGQLVTDLHGPQAGNHAAYTEVATADIGRPPGLSRMIASPDDPHKGRFGGIPSLKGFTLSAAFSNTRRHGWTRIALSIAGPADDGESACIYLHDSFPEPVRTIAFSKGKAVLTALAWGGFTVGAWLPKREIELELDLSECEGAPGSIRAR